MKVNGVRIAVTVVATALAGAHIMWPQLAIDTITLGLLALAVVPWLGEIFKSLELPGGVKVQYQDIERIQEEAEAAGLTALGRAPPAFLMIQDQDPNLALAGMRIEIERRARDLARSRGLSYERLPIGRLLEDLIRNEALSIPEYNTLRDLMTVLNRAVHAEKVERAVADKALSLGTWLLQLLEERVSPVEESP